MSLIALWIGMIGGPLAWLIYLQVSYMLVPSACIAGSKTVLGIVTAVAFVVTAGATFVAWREWRVAGETAATEEGSAWGRNRFMALSGMGISALFCLLILASAIPIIGLGACD